MFEGPGVLQERVGNMCQSIARVTRWSLVGFARLDNTMCNEGSNPLCVQSFWLRKGGGPRPTVRLGDVASRFDTIRIKVTLKLNAL